MKNMKLAAAKTRSVIFGKAQKISEAIAHCKLKQDRAKNNFQNRRNCGIEIAEQGNREIINFLTFIQTGFIQKS